MVCDGPIKRGREIVESEWQGWCGPCRATRPTYDRLRSAWDYRGAGRALILAMKDEGWEEIAHELVPPMVALYAKEWLAEGLEIDVIVPVPASRWTQWRRGFNQAESLARGLGEIIHRPVVTSALRRLPGRRKMKALDRKARLQAIGDLVALEPDAGLRGKRVLLVDDVATTGATLESCARLVRAAGAESVEAITVARTMIAG